MIEIHFLGGDSDSERSLQGGIIKDILFVRIPCVNLGTPWEFTLTGE